jgi:CRP-like cAMP-binding protein
MQIHALNWLSPTTPEDQMSDYTSRFYHKGETIFHEGFGGDSAFLVKSGQVGISRKVGDDSVPLAEFGPGEIFGEMAILLPGPRTATATMIEGGDLIHLPKDRFLEQLEQVPPIIRNTFYSLMNRLSATTDRLRPGRDHSLFVSVCRLLDQILDGLSGDKTKSLPYKDALRQIKDILLVSTSEIEEVFFQLQKLGLVICHKDGAPAKSFVFTQTEGFLGACERYYQMYGDHLKAERDQDQTLDFADLPARAGFDPERLLQLAAKGQLPQGILRFSRQGLAHWAKEFPEVARDARIVREDAAEAAETPEPVETAEA